MWSSDVQITVACAVWSSAMALLQLIAAGMALRAAWKIAADQAAAAEEVRRKARRDFIEAVAALAEEAIFEADKAETALGAFDTPNAIFYNFEQRLADIHEALQPVRSAAPADAKLILAVGKLSRVLRVDAQAGLDCPTATQIVRQHRGSIGLELGKIRSFV